MRSFGGGGMANPTPLSRYLRQAESAAIGGNMGNAKSLLGQAVAYKMRTKNISEAEARNELRQSLGARSPELRVYGRSLAPSERQQILSRMTAGQLRSYHNGQAAFGNLLSLLPHSSIAKKKSLFKGVTFQKPKRKFRSYGI
jgi:guanyl-specific ribonuclease Sa